MVDPSHGEASAIEVRNLCRSFPVRLSTWRRTVVNAVRGVTFDVRRGEMLAIVGESGSGKTTLARSIAGLDRPTSGSISIRGVDVTDRSIPDRLSAGVRCQYIFQDPYSSLNPSLPVIHAVAEPARFVDRLDKKSAGDRAYELLGQVGLTSIGADTYPRHLSGGQRQRVAIARALASRPDVLVLDEPTASLDVTTARSVLRLISQIQAADSLTCILIAHDMPTVAAVADRALVMFGGRVVEVAEASKLLTAPTHPYTIRLLESVPAIARSAIEQETKRRTLSTRFVSSLDLGIGTRLDACVFAERCPVAFDRCRGEEPRLIPYGSGWVRCHLVEGSVER